jgi:hypothetical protein
VTRISLSLNIHGYLSELRASYRVNRALSSHPRRWWEESGAALTLSQHLAANSLETKEQVTPAAMMESGIRKADGVGGIAVQIVPGFPSAIDVLAARIGGERGHLRAAWYAADGDEGGRTLIATRADGSPIAAIPTLPVGPPVFGARTVAGGYWPFRSILIDPSATHEELTEFFGHSAINNAPVPMWRVGPVYGADPATAMLKRAVSRAGWTVLTRQLGRTWRFTLPGPGEQAWPRRSTRRRLDNYERQLAQQGAVEIRHVTGADWNESVLQSLGAIEAASWVGTTTDGSGAKFLTDTQRARWRRVLTDPVLAESLSASILSVGDVPAAFSFDLRSGALQYSIASSYDERFGAWRPGKIVTYRQLEWAHGRGVTAVDLGAGDSGYKQEMGAVAGSEILDLLIVRSHSAARLLRFKWGEESAVGRDELLVALAERDAARSPFTRLEPYLAIGAIAATALTLGE